MDNIEKLKEEIRDALFELEQFEPKKYTYALSAELSKILYKFDDYPTLISFLSIITSKIDMLQTKEQLKGYKNPDPVTEENKDTYRALCKAIDQVKGLENLILSEAEAEISIYTCPTNKDIEAAIKDMSELIFECAPMKGNA
jgi:hypothetical protein